MPRTNRSWAIALTLVSVAALAAAPADAQNAVITGKVTSESGTPIDGANVSVNTLGLSVLTTSDGVYRITIPHSRAAVGQQLNLRARAVGFRPQVGALTIKAGSQTLDFEMKADGSMPDETSVRSVERARVPFEVARRDQEQGPSVPGNADPFARFLFPPELVMQHQNAIELTDSQRAALQTAIQEAQSNVIKIQWALAGEGEKLTKLLSAATLDENEVLSQVDRVLMIEREIKRTQMTLMVRIRNTLTPAQQARLRQLRG